MTGRELIDLLKEAGTQWIEDRASQLGAALAYYTTFSIAPLFIIVIGVSGLVFGEEAAQGRLLSEIRGLVGDQGGQALQSMIASASRPSSGILATILGAGVLLFGATGVFVQLQDSLNFIWEVQPKPGRGIWGILRDRFFTFAMVLAIAFLLLVSLVVSAVLTALNSWFADWQPSWTTQFMNFGVSFGILILLFAMIYKILPDAVIAWRDVWLGATITSLLFSLGKQGIGMYLGHSAVASSYGAAGSFAVLLIWLYYSAQIFYFGAELTKAYANRFGSGIAPTENAERVPKVA